MFCFLIRNLFNQEKFKVSSKVLNFTINKEVKMKMYSFLIYNIMVPPGYTSVACSSERYRFFVRERQVLFNKLNTF